MKIIKRHRWDLSPKDAVQMQKCLSKELEHSHRGSPIHTVAGIDASYAKKDPCLYVAVVVMELPSMQVIEVQSAVGQSPFPYIPGLLAFRELPLVCQALEKVEREPDVILCDGQGIAHPRRMGLAAHLGLILDVPTIGVAKSRLVGEFAPLSMKQWSQVDLIDQGQLVGVVLRTRKNVKPVFISPGNHIDVRSSVEVVRQCVRRYRLPEPTRQAHLVVNQLRLASSSCGEYVPTKRRSHH